MTALFDTLDGVPQNAFLMAIAGLLLVVGAINHHATAQHHEDEAR